MKFGKEFVSQMVPEWEEAYLDYNSLKALLKDLQHFQRRKTPTSAKASALKRKPSLYRAFSGLTTRHKVNSTKSNEDEEQILVSENNNGEDGRYLQTFVTVSSEEREYVVKFFRCLDEEFNKVGRFYKNKVTQVVKEADELSRQMDALIALRLRVDNPMVDFGAALNPINGRIAGGQHMDVIEEERDENKPCPLEILEHVKINVTPETPVSTLKGMIFSDEEQDLSFSKKELKKVEEKMKQAFTEFYEKLRLLKSYCFLNQLAFSKIMKKHDKITSRNASKVHLNMMESSYLGTCDDVPRLTERVETTFIKHFANGNHRKGMKTLRPTARREKHRITFFLGLFSGCSIALVVAIIVLIHARGLVEIDKEVERGLYMNNIFPLYSLFGLIVLHMVLFSANIYYWRQYRVNYSFIFGVKKGTEMGYRQCFLLSSGLAVLALAGVLSNLDMEMDPKTKSFTALTELVPLGLLIVVLAIIFCPFNILYRSNRFSLIQCVYHCLCAPLYKVSLPDFFLADQLTSQVQAFRSLEFYICYYGWGDFKRRSNNCQDSEVYKTFYYIVAIIPYWIRFLQCLRRLVEEKDGMQGLNGLKYLSTIVAVAMRTSFGMNKKNMTWKIIALSSSIVATVVNTYWDIVIDWGLLRRKSENRWLRDKLLIPNKSVYFVAMVLNVLLRLVWMQLVLGFEDESFIHPNAVIAIVACLEIIRRGIWNFFRLENEHLNNVGKYRAFKSVPLPFNYYHDQGKSK